MLTRFQEMFKEVGYSEYMYPTDQEKNLQYRKAMYEMRDALTTQLFRKYIEKDERNEAKVLRPSVIGKLHTFDLLYATICMFSKERLMSEKLNLIFSMGHFFEAWVIFTMKRMGYQLEEDVTLKDGGLEGHADIIVTDDDGKRYVVEVKTASSNYFSRVLKEGVDDSRGYLTQACCYQQMSGLPLLWLFINKDTCDMILIPMSEAVPKDTIEHRFNRAKALSECTVKELIDVYRVTDPPAPSLEKDRHGNYKLDDNGKPRLYVPFDAIYPDIYYVTEEGRTSYGKKRKYVTAISYPSYLWSGDELIQYAIETDIDNLNTARYLTDHFRHWLKS